MSIVTLYMLAHPLPQSRQLKHVVQTHRTATLQAIAQNVHASTARISYLKTEAERIRDIVKNMPGSGTTAAGTSGSKIDWLHRQLNKT